MSHLPRPTDSPSAASKRVLLVDDNVDAVESMEILLQAFGYEVATAIHPDLALGQLESFAPAAAVIDIGLPGMDGYQLAAEIRRRLGDRPMRLIAFTGYGSPDDVARARAAGFDAHLVKPVEIASLLAALGGA
jgi:CheY-like chemotaxis protein